MLTAHKMLRGWRMVCLVRSRAHVLQAVVDAVRSGCRRRDDRDRRLDGLRREIRAVGGRHRGARAVSRGTLLQQHWRPLLRRRSARRRVAVLLLLRRRIRRLLLAAGSRI